jgi:hypothetical protein
MARMKTVGVRLTADLITALKTQLKEYRKQFGPEATLSYTVRRLLYEALDKKEGKK